MAANPPVRHRTPHNKQKATHAASFRRVAKALRAECKLCGTKSLDGHQIARVLDAEATLLRSMR